MSGPREIELDGTPVPLRMRITLPDGLDLTVPFGTHTVSRITVGQDDSGIYFHVQLLGLPSGTVVAQPPRGRH